LNPVRQDQDVGRPHFARGAHIFAILKGQEQMSDYKGFSKAALDAVRQHPQEFEAFIKAGGTLPMQKANAF
jgi:hypothetical protein